MRRRFQQNTQDISFTIMTYVPLLSKHVLEEMDVEALTAELQSLSRASKARQVPRALEQEQQSPKGDPLESSLELIRSSDARSEASSASFFSVSPRPNIPQLAESKAELPPIPGNASQASEAPTLESQGTSSIPSLSVAEPKALSESVVSSSAVSSNGDSLVSA